MRPVETCHCPEIPRISNRTEVLIFQDIRERSHPFNTGRMVNQALANAVMVTDYSDQLERHAGLVRDDAILLYPSRDAVSLDSASRGLAVGQLVVIDGTWDQARRMFRNFPRLQRLPRYRLEPDHPGQYRIRLEPDGQSLSTVEAVVSALRILEPETAGFEKLLRAFSLMVERQLAHPQAEYQRQRVPKKQSVNIPHAIAREYDRLVVAYGEAAPADGRIVPKATRRPVYWVAKHLATGRVFQQTVNCDLPISDGLLEHFELPRAHFCSSVSPSLFARLWSEFLDGTGIVVVYNAGTLGLLNSMQLTPERSIELKSIRYDPHRKHRTLAEFFRSRSIGRAEVSFPGRAGKRLANIETLVNHLRELATR